MVKVYTGKFILSKLHQIVACPNSEISPEIRIPVCPSRDLDNWCLPIFWKESIALIPHIRCLFCFLPVSPINIIIPSRGPPVWSLGCCWLQWAGSSVPYQSTRLLVPRRSSPTCIPTSYAAPFSCFPFGDTGLLLRILQLWWCGEPEQWTACCSSAKGAWFIV